MKVKWSPLNTRASQVDSIEHERESSEPRRIIKKTYMQTRLTVESALTDNDNDKNRVFRIKWSHRPLMIMRFYKILQNKMSKIQHQHCILLYEIL